MDAVCIECQRGTWDHGGMEMEWNISSIKERTITLSLSHLFQDECLNVPIVLPFFVKMINLNTKLLVKSLRERVTSASLVIVWDSIHALNAKFVIVMNMLEERDLSMKRIRPFHVQSVDLKPILQRILACRVSVVVALFVMVLNHKYNTLCILFSKIP